jgi:hypothetical protein
LVGRFVATSGEKRWPPVGKFVAASGENSMAIDRRHAPRANVGLKRLDVFVVIILLPVS